MTRDDRWPCKDCRGPVMWTTRELLHLLNKVYAKTRDKQLVDEIQRIIDGLHRWVRHDAQANPKDD